MTSEPTVRTTVAIIQARMASTRLPGKVLADLGGTPMLGWIVGAARMIPGVDEVVVATSDVADDDPIETWGKTENVRVVRGPLEDVLARFVKAADSVGAGIVLRLTADCPFLDPHVAGQVLALMRIEGADYASNTQPATWADGLDCEAVTIEALRQAATCATRPSDREHVTPFVYRHRASFRCVNLRCPIPGLEAHRWTVDDPADLERARAMAPHLRPGASFGETLEAAGRLPHAETAARNEGFSLSKSREALPRITDFTASNTRFRETVRRIPLASQTFSKSSLQLPAPFAPLFVTHAQGARIFDVDGNEYVDVMMSLLPVILGYCDADVDAAITDQLGRGIIHSMPTGLEFELAEILARLVPSAEQTRFGKNGSDATAGAIRLARALTGKEHIIACGYHGWQDWYIGGTARHFGVPQAVRDLVHMVPYNDLEALEQVLKTHAGTVAAVIMEPMNTTYPAPGYLEEVRALTHRHDALLVFDEVITGFRFALGGAQELFGVAPDLTAFGKGMANGMPLSAVTGPAELMKMSEEIFFSFTNGGEALSLAAAVATLRKLERDRVPDQLEARGLVLHEAVMRELGAVGLQDIIGFNGHPSWKIMAVHDHPSARKEAIKTFLLKELIARGVLFSVSHNICAAHGEAELSHVVRAWKEVAPLLAEELAKGQLEARLPCPVIEPVFKVR